MLSRDTKRLPPPPSPGENLLLGVSWADNGALTRGGSVPSVLNASL